MNIIKIISLYILIAKYNFHLF